MCVIMVASGLEDVKFSGLNFILNNLLCVSLCLSCFFFFFFFTSEIFFFSFFFVFLSFFFFFFFFLLLHLKVFF